jgi:hypothetical protein
MRKWIIAVLVMTALAFPAAGLAHEGHTHRALGTITSIQGVHVGIKTNDGKTLKLMLDTKTAVTRGKEKLDAAALKIGERVSVEYMESNKMMMAQAIKLGATATATAKK